MRVYKGFDSLPTFVGAVAAVGSFDGLHSGHHVMIARLKELAEERGGESILLTFEPHPRIVLGRADGLQLLTTLEEKVILAERIGIDNLIVIPFDEEFSRLSYLDFVKQYLVAKVGISALVVGYNHRFGRDHEGNYSRCLDIAESCNFSLERVEEWRDEDCKVSSTVLRSMIAAGDMSRAGEMLSHPYLIVGEANNGIVNITEPLKLLPKGGDYTAQVNGSSGEKISISGRKILLEECYSGEVTIEIIE